ncbi:MAG: PHP domain-containing protein [Treponema sp.]|nr:PHP domain-containing protein [Treponema sp.]
MMNLRQIIATIPVMVDLHTHSNVSDGHLSPDLLIKEAVRLGIRAIALTDHDTINGLDSARISAEACAEDIYFIPGIEININWNSKKTPRGAPGLGPGGEFHLLGLGINKPSPAFIDAIGELSRRREARNREILDRMYELSLIDTVSSGGDQISAWDELMAISGGNSMGRPHFATFLVKRKIVKNQNQAFKRYLGVGKPLYVPKEGMIFEEAVTLIRESGGLPVLAHPSSLYVAWGRFPDLAKILKNQGLMGIEAWHPTAKPGSCRRLEALALSLGLYITEGSDFHGSTRPDRRLGYSGRGRKISDTVLEAIPELMQKNRL